jgi:hypothetical protein
MSRRIVLIAAASIVAALAGCGRQPSRGAEDTRTAKSAMPNVPDNFDSQGRHILLLTLSPGGDARKPSFSGLANLPDGTALQISLFSKATGHLNGQDDITIKDGRFTSQSFSRKGEPLLPGSYRVELTSPMSDIQPDSVKQVVGKEYENYVGKDLSDGGIARTIDRTMTIRVPGTLTASVLADARKQDDVDLRQSMMESCAYIEKVDGRPTRTDAAEAKIAACADRLMRRVKAHST